MEQQKWHNIVIPDVFEPTYKTQKRLDLKLERQYWSRQEFFGKFYRTDKYLQAWVFCVPWKWDKEKFTYTATMAQAAELIRSRETYAHNSGFDFHFRLDRGELLANTLLSEVARQILTD